MLGPALQSIQVAGKAYLGQFEVIIVDNNSEDGTVETLKPQFPLIHWIALPHNLGFGAGCNRGVLEAGGELLLFLNPDTLIEKDTLNKMAQFFVEKPEAGIVGCRILNADRSLQLACRRSFPTPLTALYKFLGLSRLFPQSQRFGRYNLTFLKELEENVVDAVSGSFMCIKKQVFSEVGGFDTDFFMYGEDLDLCYRVQRMGRTNWYTPRTSITHFKGQSAKSRPLISLFHFYSAMVIFSRKHFELRPLPLALFYMGALFLGLSNYIRNTWPRWPRWLLDLSLANLALYSAAGLYARFTTGVPFYTFAPLIYGAWHFLLSLTLFVILGLGGEYGNKIPSKVRSAQTLGFAFLLFYALAFFFYEINFSRISLAVTGVLSFIVLMGWRLLHEQGRLFRSRFLVTRQKLLVVGDDTRSQEFVRALQANQETGLEFLGLITLKNEPKSSLEQVGTLDSLSGLCKQLSVQRILVAQEEGAYSLALKVLRIVDSQPICVGVLLGQAESRTIQWVDLHLEGNE